MLLILDQKTTHIFDIAEFLLHFKLGIHLYLQFV